MNRQDVLELLRAHRPFNDKEDRDREEMISFIESENEPFSRSTSRGHITASAWLLNQNKDQALLMHHRKLGLWLQLGGHCDGDEDILGVALKEAREESGLIHLKPLATTIFDIDIHRIPANAKEPEHKHYDIRFLLGLESDDPLVSNEESLALRWVGLEEDALPPVDESVLRLHQKWSFWLKDQLMQ